MRVREIGERKEPEKSQGPGSKIHDRNGERVVEDGFERKEKKCISALSSR